ncbi:MAG: PilZ domain-containing protein [Acidobacteriota bacterium]|nr:MAG: PilZ domain-containing protein [Acidobacteriota bacterium]
MFRDMGLMEAAARSIENMASASLHLGEEDSAFDYLSRGLTLSREIESHPVSLILLTGVAQLLIRKGRVSSALELLALVDSHPRSPDEARIKVQEVATKANLRLSAATGQHSHLDRSLSKIIEEAISECASILEKEKASANEYLERRHHRRFLRAVPCKIEWENGRLRSETADLSLGGARLMAIDKFPPKDSSVKVILGRDALTRTVQATVRHLDISLFPQTFGVEFAQPIQPNDLQQLVAV